MQTETSVFRACVRLMFLIMHLLLVFFVAFVCRIRYGKDWFNTERGRYLIKWWMRQTCRILAIRLQVKGVSSTVQNTLFVANHISWIDIIALASLLDTKFISKRTVKSWPVIGWLATIIGTLYISRGNKFAVNRVIDQIRAELDNNNAVLLFPEGTTTDGRQIARFHASLFKVVSGGEDHMVQAIALRYQRQGRLDNYAPYIVNDNFVAHLFRLAALTETCLEVVFTSPFQAVAMSRHEIAETAHNHIAGILMDRQEAMSIPQRIVA